jgi:hypothetical protein
MYRTWFTVVLCHTYEVRLSGSDSKKKVPYYPLVYNKS